MKNIFGTDDHPYYVWAPRWIESSAGIRCVHYLCHSLNAFGAKAFIVFAEPRLRGEPRVNPDLMTPELSTELIDAHLSSGKVPIAIYPEDVIGNPLGAPIVVRILWNFAGALGGPSSFDVDEIMVAFSETIAKDYEARGHAKPHVLFVPPVDPEEFPSTSEKEAFQVVYAGKYRSFVGRPPTVGTLPTVEIFRDGPKKQPRDLVKKLLADASVVYSFENSSIVTEAILSGTPAGFVPNQFMGEIIAKEELGMGGTFIGDDPLAVTSARATLSEGRASYLRAVERFPSELEFFYSMTQRVASTLGFSGPITLPSIGSPVTRNRILLGLRLLKTKGLRAFIVEVDRFLRSRL